MKPLPLRTYREMMGLVEEVDAKAKRPFRPDGDQRVYPLRNLHTALDQPEV